MLNYSIFIFSLLFSTITILLERIVGIEWDFHPDSVTYATQSSEVSELIFNDNVFALFNNAYYVVCFILGESVILITLMNFLLFALSNVFIYKLHLRLSSLRANESLAVSFLLMFNPYRLHLSTTLLKDTIIIFILLCIVYNGIKFKSFVSLIAIRLASVLYMIIFLNKKIIWFFAAIFFLAVFSMPELSVVLEGFNSQEMNFREDVSINAFQDYGLLGIFIRATVWPLLALGGIYVFVKPALMYAPLALGQWMQIMYMKRLGVDIFDVRILSVLYVFAVMVTGFTSYLRYIMPIMVIAPFINLVAKK